jgi:hypothetical protein
MVGICSAASPDLRGVHIALLIAARQLFGFVFFASRAKPASMKSRMIQPSGRRCSFANLVSASCPRLYDRQPAPLARVCRVLCARISRRARLPRGRPRRNDRWSSIASCGPIRGGTIDWARPRRRCDRAQRCDDRPATSERSNIAIDPRSGGRCVRLRRRRRGRRRASRSPNCTARGAAWITRKERASCGL